MVLLQEVNMSMSSFSLVVGKIWPSAKFFISDATGASGGLVTMWDPSHFSSSLLSSSANLLVFELSSLMNSLPMSDRVD